MPHRLSPHRKCLAAAVLLGAILFGCGPPGDESPAPVETTGAIEDPAAWGLQDFIERCGRITDQFRPASIVYDPAIRMEYGRPSPVTAMVTLDRAVPPEDLIDSDDAVAREVRVSCEVEAQLTGASDEFDIDPAGWRRQSFLTSSEASWTWHVTPHRGGDRELALVFRPVVTAEVTTAGGITHVTASEHTETIAVHVDMSAMTWTQEKIDRLASFFTSVQGLLVAIGAAIGAAVTIRAQLHRKRRRNGDTSGGTPDAAQSDARGPRDLQNPVPQPDHDQALTPTAHTGANRHSPPSP